MQYLWHPVVAARPSQVMLLANTQHSENTRQDARLRFEQEVRDGVARWEEALARSREVVSVTIDRFQVPEQEELMNL